MPDSDLNTLPEEIRPAPPPTWDDVKDEYATSYPDLDQGDLQKHFEMTRNMAIARKVADLTPESTGKWLYRRAAPFFGSFAGVSEDSAYKQARGRYEAGKPDIDDFQTIAEYEKQRERDADFQKTWGGSIADVAARIPAIAGEAYASGGTGAGGGLLKTLGRKAMQAPLMPSLYLGQASQRSVEQGGQVTSPQNLAPALGMGMLQNMVLGSLPNLASGLKNPVSRFAARVGLGAGEMEGLNIAAGALDKILPEAYRTQTQFGSLGKALRGDLGDAAREVTANALVVAAFAAVHELPGGAKSHIDDIKDAFNTSKTPDAAAQAIIARIKQRGLPDWIVAGMEPGSEQPYQQGPPPPEPQQPPLPNPLGGRPEVEPGMTWQEHQAQQRQQQARPRMSPEQERDLLNTMIAGKEPPPETPPEQPQPAPQQPGPPEPSGSGSTVHFPEGQREYNPEIDDRPPLGPEGPGVESTLPIPSVAELVKRGYSRKKAQEIVDKSVAKEPTEEPAAKPEQSAPKTQQFAPQVTREPEPLDPGEKTQEEAEGSLDKLTRLVQSGARGRAQVGEWMKEAGLSKKADHVFYQRVFMARELEDIGQDSEMGGKGGQKQGVAYHWKRAVKKLGLPDGWTPESLWAGTRENHLIDLAAQGKTVSPMELQGLDPHVAGILKQHALNRSDQAIQWTNDLDKVFGQESKRGQPLSPERRAEWNRWLELIDRYSQGKTTEAEEQSLRAAAGDAFKSSPVRPAVGDELQGGNAANGAAPEAEGDSGEQEQYQAPAGVPKAAIDFLKEQRRKGENVVLDDAKEILQRMFPNEDIGAVMKEVKKVKPEQEGKIKRSGMRGHHANAEGGFRKYELEKEIRNRIEVGDFDPFSPAFGMGAATPGQGSPPPPPGTPGASHMPTPEGPPQEPYRQSFFQKIANAAKSLAQRTFPRLTRQSPATGEAVAAASNATATIEKTWDYMKNFLRIGDKKLGDIKADSPEDILYGATWMEERFRHYRQWLQSQGMDASGVRTLIGQPNSPLTSEKVFQDALQEMWGFNQAVIQEWTPKVEGYYRQLHGMAPLDPIDAATQIPGRPLNAIARNPEAPDAVSASSRSGGGNSLANINIRKGGYTKAADLDAPAYDVSLTRMMKRTLDQRIPEATRADAVRTGLQEGVIKAIAPGQRAPEHWKPLELQPAKGIPELPQGAKYYAHPEAYIDLTRGLGIGPTPAETLGLQNDRQGVRGRLTSMALITPSELITHLAVNLPKGLFAEGMGIPGMNGGKWLKNAYDLYSKNPAILEKVMKLAEIGAAFEDRHVNAGLFGEAAKAIDPTYYFHRFTSGLIDLMNNSMRVQLGDAYDQMARSGKIKESDASKRDFINSFAGNYNTKMGGAITALLRHTGLQPFAVAARTYTSQGVQAGLMHPWLNVQPTDISSRIQLHAMQIAKLAPFLALGPLYNYSRWGDPFPQGVTPFAMKTSEDKENNKVGQWDPLNIPGIRRGWRATTLNAGIEGAVKGDKTAGQVFDRATGDVVNTAKHLALGPLAETANIAATGKDLYGRQVAAKVSTATTPAGIAKAKERGEPEPGSSQEWQNLRGALLHVSPLASSLMPESPREQQKPLSERVERMYGPFWEQTRSMIPIRKKGHK